MYNESKKRSTIKYLAKLKEVRFRVKPEEFQKMEQAAERLGYSSMRQFYLAAINEKMRATESTLKNNTMGI